MKPFVRFITWARKQFRPRRPRPIRFAPIVLERLEERYITSVVAGMEGTGAFGPGSASWALDGRTALISGTGEANRGTEPLLFPVSEAHTAGQGPGARFYLAPLPLADGVARSGSHEDSTQHLDALFAGTSRPRFGGAGLKHYSGLNPSPPAPEDQPPPSWSVAGPDAAGSAVPVYRASLPDQTSDPAPSDSVGAPVDTALSPVVTPSVRSFVSLGALLDAGIDGFRITRSPVSDATMEVRYALTEYSSAGAVRHEYMVAIPAGTAHVDIANELPPAGQANQPEIVTLTILDNGDYQTVQPTVARFLSGNAHDCSEPALVAAFQEKKLAEAFGALVARNRSSVMQTCYGVLRNWHDAEDVTQMVFLALAQQPMQWQNSLAGWLRTVARNASIVFLRSRSRRTRHEYHSAKPIMVASEEPQRELREELDVALSQLSAPLRDAVQLRYLEGWSQMEAARMLGCPRGTLSQRAALGVRHLRGILGQRNGITDKD